MQQLSGAGDEIGSRGQWVFPYGPKIGLFGRGCYCPSIQMLFFIQVSRKHCGANTYAAAISARHV